MKLAFNLMIAFSVFSILITACSPQQETEPQTAVLNLMTHDSFAVSEEVIRQFEEENQITVNFLQSGDTGAALNRPF